ncbi:MAG TPA: flagellar biosynthetic protein FliO [Kofleriaceae bacterium]|nr:flagellar biosynthetic protein FliO [Kofleriaceae bacterium]
MRLAVALVALVVPALASAAPAPEAAIEVIDRGNAVEVIAHNVKATHTTITPVRSRLEVPVAVIPYVASQAPSQKDATIKEIDFENQSLSVKLNFERPDVKTLAKFAQATQVGDDLHVIIPRAVPAEGATVTLPEPTLPPAIAAKLAEAQKAMAKPEIKVEPKAEPKVEAPIDVKPAIAKTDVDTRPVPKKAIPTVPADDSWSKISIYAAMGLGALGLGAWLLNKKRAVATPTSTIDVIAQRSLGGKAKVMWLAAGTREMIVSVSPQGVRMLGQWKRTGAPNNDVPLPLPEAQTVERSTSGRLLSRAATSPAVSGLIRLRAQTHPAVSHEVATEDVEADAQWAKDLLAATGGRR